jgi:hypothetical protein
VRRARGGRDGPAAAAADQRPDRRGQFLPVAAAQQHPACVRLELPDLPIGAVQHQPATRRQLDRAQCDDTSAHRSDCAVSSQARGQAEVMHDGEALRYLTYNWGDVFNFARPTRDNDF